MIFLAIAGEAAANAECALGISDGKLYASTANNMDFLTSRDLCVAEVILH
jgi:hypothetical protein